LSNYIYFFGKLGYDEGRISPPAQRGNMTAARKTIIKTNNEDTAVHKVLLFSDCRNGALPLPFV
jgi:hypothetical protein